tara:strand:- start:32 stop:340 length:309 start_codon:yes stop_codon:yes gene_type:complete
MRNISDADWKEVVLGSEKPVLVDFWAEWCGPCKLIAPVLEAVSKKRDDFEIVKLNVDHNSMATEYGIRSIPTLLLFNKGEVAGTIVGTVSESGIYQLVDNLN